MENNEPKSNLRYPVQVEKMKMLLQERLCELNEGLTEKEKKINTIPQMLEDQRIIGRTTYNRILHTRTSTQKALNELKNFIGCEFEELIDPNSDEKKVKDRKIQVSSVTELIEKTDPELLANISELLERLIPARKIQDFSDFTAIGYKRNMDGTYQVVVPLSSEWEKLYPDLQPRIYKVTVKADEKMEEKIIKVIQKKLCARYRYKETVGDSELMEKSTFEEQIKKIEDRRLIEIENPNLYMKTLANNYLNVMIEKLDETGHTADQFEKDAVIAYINLGEGVYEVTLPFKEDYCGHILGADFPLKLEVELSDEEEEENFEEVFRERITDQFESDYGSFLNDGESDKIIEELSKLELEEYVVEDFDWLDSKENTEATKCYAALFRVLDLRGEMDEIEKVIAAPNSTYAFKKFKQFGIPIPFERKE